MKTLLTLNDFRVNLTKYIKKIEQGNSFTVYKHAKPIFTVVPTDDDQWETVIDFTLIQKGGIPIDALLERL